MWSIEPAASALYGPRAYSHFLQKSMACSVGNTVVISYNLWYSGNDIHCFPACLPAALQFDVYITCLC